MPFCSSPVRTAVHLHPGPRRPSPRPRKGSAPPFAGAPAPRAEPARHTVREAWSTPRTGPPPAGNEATVFPQPTVSSAAGRPTQHPCKRSRRSRARAHGRAHGHTPGARGNTSAGRSGEGRRGRIGRGAGRTPARGSGLVGGPDRTARTPPPCRAPGLRPTPRAAVRAISARGRGGAPQSLLHAPAIPPLFLRATFASRPPLPPLRPLPPPGSPLITARWPVRTTIPPYGRPALNGRDAANYAGFTDVLSRAAYSSGLGQMRVRPECRGSSLGRTRYECRAPHR